MHLVDATILGIISMYPASGYDMKIEMEKGGAGLFSALTFGSIYPRLRALEQDGYIQSFEADTQGRKRRLHELTAKGWQALSDWLASSSAYPIPMRDELLLKISLWSGARGEDRQTLIEHLRLRRDESVALLEYLRTWPHNNHSYISEYGMIAISYGRSRLEAELTWIEETITQLAGAPRGPVQDPRGLAPQQQARREAALARAQDAEDDETSKDSFDDTRE
jgi:DNA-binding PadR family transcriptional regulator